MGQGKVCLRSTRHAIEILQVGAILRKTSVERIAKLVADPVYREKPSDRISGKFPENFLFGVTTRGYEVESAYSSSFPNLWDAHDLHAVDGPILGNLLGK